MKAILVGIFAMMTLSMLTASSLSGLGPVVISQLQTGDVLAATNEAVELYNNAVTDQDVTNWCIRYSSASSQAFATSPRYCFVPPDEYTQIFLTSRSYATVVTAGYMLPGGLSPDARFSGSGMASAGGHIRLVDSQANSIDVLGWGSAVYGEGYSLANLAPVAPNASQALVRKTSLDGSLQDTDNNRADFELKPPLLRNGGIYELRTPVDLCGNILDIQEALPDGFGYDEAGNCELLAADQCNNIEAIQLEIPSDLLRTDEGTCHKDICQGIEGLQLAVPPGYWLNGDDCAELERRELWLSEFLPNASGSDSGKEFIEIYNPHDVSVSLYGYRLMIGKSLESTYELAADDSVTIPAKGFAVFGDDELGFTLLNTTNRIQLIAPGGNIVSEAQYANPDDDQSWALIGGEWQYTNRPTPLEANLVSLVFEEEVEGAAVIISPCVAGKYRHPITNRCRNIESDTTMLVACDADEYRNPETNRCRKIAALSVALSSCASGYERNTETNRCRKVGSSETKLTPCEIGYERNLTTNRCRKAVSVTTPAMNTASAVKTSSDSTLTNALIITAGLGAASYGLYEWRSELLRGVRRLIQLTSGK